MRICLLTDSAPPPGVGEHMMTLATAMTDVAATVAGRNGTGLLDRAAAQGLAVKTIDDDHGALTRWLQRDAPDLVHIHAGIGWEGNAAVCAAAAAGVP